MLKICFKHFCISFVWVLRVLALMLFTLIVIVVIGGFAAVKIFTPENLSTITSGKMYEILQRPVMVGKVSVVFFKGIKIQNVSILDTSNNLGRNLISGNEITLSYKFLPLFKKQVILDEITINKPQINLIKNKDGKWNFEGLLPKKGGKPGKISGLDLYFNIKKININNAIVTVINLPKDRKDIFYNVNLELSDVERNGEFPYKITLVSKNEIAKKTISLEISADGYVNMADFNWRDACVLRTSAEVYFLSKPINLNIEIKNFKTPVFSALVRVPQIVYKDLSLFIKKPASINIPASKWQVNGSVGDRIEVKSVVGDFGGIVLKSSGWIEFLKNTAKFRFNIKSSLFDAGILGQYWAKMLKFAPGGKSRFEIDLSGDKNNISFDKISFTAKNAKAVIGDFICSKMDFNALLENGLDKITLKTSNAAVKVYNQTFSALKINGSYFRDTIKISGLTGKYNGSSLKTKIYIENLQNNTSRKVSTIIKLEHLKLPMLFDTVKDFSKAVSKKPPRPVKYKGELSWLRNFRYKLPGFIPNFKGTVYAGKLTTPVISGSDLKLDFDLNGLYPHMEKLNGRIDAVIGPGIIHQLEKMAEKRKALDVAFKPFIAMHQLEQSGGFQSGILKNAGYKQVAGAFDFKNGVATIHNFFIDGIKLSADAKGRVDWVGENLNIDVKTLFKTTGHGGLSENLTDETGSPALSFKVTGSMLKADVAMKSPKGVSRHIENAIKQSVRTKFLKLSELK